MKNNLSAPAALLASALASTSLTAAPACNPTSIEACGLPFPSNHLTLPDASSPTGKRPQFDDGVLSSGVLAELQTRTGLAPAELFNQSSGFSAASPVVFELSGAPGVAIPEDGGDLVQAFDLSTGERVPVRARISEYARSAEVSTPADVLEVFPADRWMYGHDILVVLTSGLALSGDRDLAEVFAETDSNDYLADLAERLQQQGLAPGDVINATTFTVRDRKEVVTPLNTLVEEIRSSDRPVRNVEVDYNYLTWFSAGEVTGEVLLENYRADQGTGMVDFDATPTEQWVEFTLALPASARNGSVPVALYAHSLGGDQTPPLLTRFVNSLGGVATFSIDFPNHGARATRDGGGLGDPGGFPLGLMTQASLDFAAAEAALRSSLADLDVAGPRTWYNWRGRYGDGVADINVNELILQGEGKAGERFDALTPGFLQTSLFQVEDTSLTRLLAEGDLWDLFPGLVPPQATGAEALMIRSAIQQALDYGDAINFGDSPVYTVNVNAGSGGQVTPAGSHDLIRGQRGVFTLIPDNGYEVDSASGCGGALTDNVYTTGPVSANCTVSVSFRQGGTTEPETYTVSVSSDAGGTLSPAEDQSVAEGETASFTVSTETGYRLGEVTGCDGSLSGNVYTTGAIAADCTVSASFESLQYEVSASAESGGTISPAGTQSVTHGDNADFTLAAESGYSLVNVEGCDGSLSGNTYTTGSITSDCSVTASFTMDPVPVLVIASAGNGGSISPAGTQSLTEGQTTTFTVSADEGYRVAVVSGCDGTLSGNTYTTGTLASDCVVTASFDPMSVEVNASAGDGGSISPSGLQSLAYGETASFTVSADEGYSVAGVSGCGGTLSGDTFTTAALTADCAVTASFDQNVVEVSAGAGEGGNISPSGVQSLAYGETASFSVTADEGYSVADVSGCDGTLSGDTYTTGALTTDCAVTVSFDHKMFEVTASAENGGSLSPAGIQSVAYGDTATFSVAVDEGYELQTVTGCGGSLSGNTYTTGAITGACSVQASFQEVEPDPSEGAAGRASGVIRDGQVALSVWNGSEWVPQGSPVETNEAGYFSLDYPDTDQPVRLELTAIAGTTMRCPLASGCGVNAGFGKFFPVDPETFALSAIVPGDHLSGDGVVTISPLTHMAASWVEGLPLGPTNAGVELALTRVRTLFGLDEGFATRLPVDLAEPEEVSAATEADLRHALLASAFPELAFGTSTDQAVVYELETLLQGAGQMFNLLGGQAVVRSGEFNVADLEQLITDLGGDPETLLAEYELTDVSLAGLDSLVAAAASVSGNLLDGAQELSLTESLMDLLVPFGDRIITNLGGTTGFDPADMDRALVVLDDFDQFHTAAEAGSAGIEEVNRNLAWLTADESGTADNKAMGEAVNEAFGYIGSAAVCHLVQSYSTISSCITGLEGYPLDSPDGYARLRVTDETSSLFGSRMNAGELILSGTRPGNQQVDLVIDTFNLGELLDGEPKAFGIQGAIANSTATLELDLTVELDLSGNPEANAHFQARSGSALWWTSSDGANVEAGLEKLLADLRFGISMEGSASITSTDPSIGTHEVTNIDANMLFNRRVLTRGASGAVLDLALRSGNRTNPAGETASGLAGQDIFRLILSDPISLSMARVTDELGVPPVEFRSSGTLAGSGPFLEVLGEYITAALDPDVPLDSVDFEQLTEGLNLDLLSMDGGSELSILDPAGARTYNIASRDGALVVSSPNSEEDALSLVQAGVAGYIYSGDSLISTVHLGNVEDGLLLSLVNGERRSYRNGAGDEPQSLDAIMEQLRTILESFADYFAIDSGETAP